MSLAPWRSPISRALHRNRSLPYARYLQLATVDHQGLPQNRTVVFRGFRDNSDQLQIVTDSRSAKIPEIEQHNWVEICWYFPKTREQFRLSGNISIINVHTPETDLQQLRHQVWSTLSDSAKLQFSWPEPKSSRTFASEAFDSFLSDMNQPLDNFCLLLVDVNRVDHLELRGNPQNRHIYTLNQKKVWQQQEVNP